VATSPANGATSTVSAGAFSVTTGAGEPVEFSLVAGSEADVSVLKDLELDLPEGSTLFADKAYTPTTTTRIYWRKSAYTLEGPAQEELRAADAFLCGKSSWANRFASTSRRSSAG
jgi:hypothetical protein